MATVSAKIYEHHEKTDGTFNVKYVIYHQGERKFIDSPHFISKRQITKEFEIKDKLVLKWLNETLDDYRTLINGIGYRLDFLPANNCAITCGIVTRTSILLSLQTFTLII